MTKNGFECVNNNVKSDDEMLALFELFFGRGPEYNAFARFLIFNENATYEEKLRAFEKNENKYWKRSNEGKV